MDRLSILFTSITWFKSIMNVDKGTDTVSMVRIRVKIASLILIFADSAGTKLPMCAKYTINPTLNEKLN